VYIKFLLIFFFTLTAHAENYQIASNLLLIADWGQTRYIADHTQYHEINKSLGKHPDTGDVNRHFVGAIILNNLIGEYLIPADKKKYFYICVTYAEAFNLARNYNLGIKIKF